MTQSNSERIGVLEDWRERTDEWQREQNGHLKSLAQSYADLSECISNDKAYRKGRIDTMKLLVGLAGTSGAASIGAILIQLFS